MIHPISEKTKGLDRVNEHAESFEIEHLKKNDIEGKTGGQRQIKFCISLELIPLNKFLLLILDNLRGIAPANKMELIEGDLDEENSLIGNGQLSQKMVSGRTKETSKPTAIQLENVALEKMREWKKSKQSSI
jgi:hypothetical protein